MSTGELTIRPGAARSVNGKRKKYETFKQDHFSMSRTDLRTQGRSLIPRSKTSTNYVVY